MKLQHVSANQSEIFVKLECLRATQVRKWDEKASQLAREVDRIQSEAGTRSEQIKKMSASMKSCSKRLTSLATPSEKETKGKSRLLVAVLEDSVTAIEKLVKAEREKVQLLEGRLAEAEKELEAIRPSLAVSAAEIETLRNQLSVAIQNGRMHAARAGELEEKMQCSICMDRPKNVAFACGHTCCDQCASEWKRCPNKCQGGKSQKPVKHTFRLYF
ncbi:E3 ubiquitin-protein ligase MIB2-like protein [Aphelenchoides avenae]|nr:E3 ubiquitin-protein ligase MIB2-like protein [Aphelenchus avenae]